MIVLSASLEADIRSLVLLKICLAIIIITFLKYVYIVNMSPMLMIQRMTIIFRKTAPTSMANCSAYRPPLRFILFGILTTRAFQRVVNHSCGWSMSQEICNQNWYDFQKYGGLLL